MGMKAVGGQHVFDLPTSVSLFLLFLFQTFVYTRISRRRMDGRRREVDRGKINDVKCLLPEHEHLASLYSQRYLRMKITTAGALSANCLVHEVLIARRCARRNFLGGGPSLFSCP